MIIIASTLRSDPSVRVADAARLRLDAGCGALALAAPFYRHEWEALRPMLPRESVLAVELFVPFGSGARPERLPPGRTSPFCLGALNREEVIRALRSEGQRGDLGSRRMLTLSPGGLR